MNKGQALDAASKKALRFLNELKKTKGLKEKFATYLGKSNYSIYGSKKSAKVLESDNCARQYAHRQIETAVEWAV